MKMAEAPNTVERGDLPKERGYTIAATSKAFEILSSGIYKDAVTAICRELGTNAADSHVMAGKKEVPFSVHLPTSLEPWFEVKDEGVGLDERQINGIYTTYFASDKTHSNELTGCLGLGSKSPFSYTDQFSIVTIKDGFKRTYVAFMNEEGFPQISRMGTTRTAESSGVSIRLAVKREDFNEFHTKAAVVYRWFSPQPHISSLTFQEEKYILRGSDWALSSFGSATVVMGNVGYPLAGNDLAGLGLSPAESALARRIILWVDLGDVDIAASRESLKLTKRTIDLVATRIRRAAVEAAKHVENEIAGCTTLWEARLKRIEFCTNDYLRDVVNKLQPKWNGIDAASHIDTTYRDPRTHARSVYCTLKRAEPYRSRGFMLRDADVIEVHPSTEIYYSDVRSRTNGLKLRHRAATIGRSVVYLIEPYGPAATEYQQFIDREQLGPVLRKVSSLPAPPTIQRRRVAQVITMRGGSWNAAEVDFDEGGIYVPIQNQAWRCEALYGDWISQHHFNEFLQKVKPLLRLNADVVGVRRQGLKKFERAEQWVSLNDTLRAAVQAPSLQAACAIGELWESIANTVPRATEIHSLHSVTEIPMTSPLRQLAIELHKIHRTRFTPKVKAAIPICARVGINLPDVAKMWRHVTSLGAEASKRYTLLPYLSGTAFTDGLPEFVRYVRAMDRAVRE
jgi:hypothetical protein